MKSILLNASLAGILSSCAFHSGNVSSGSVIDCPLRYTAKGIAKTNKLFGIGGLERDALIVEAKQDLYTKFPYSKEIKLSNFAVDFKTSFIFFYSSTKVTVSADVFDCSATSGNNSIEKNSSATLSGGLKKGDSITFEYNGYHKGTYLQETTNGRYHIEYLQKNGARKQRKIDPDLVFKTSVDPSNINYYGFNIGDNAFIEVDNLKTKVKSKKSCKIIGINSTSAVISYIKDDGIERILTVNKLYLKK